MKGVAGWGEGRRMPGCKWIEEWSHKFSWARTRTCLTIICQINVMRLKSLVNLLGLLVQCYYHKLTLRYNLLFKVGCNCMFHDVFITDYEAKKNIFGPHLVSFRSAAGPHGAFKYPKSTS